MKIDIFNFESMTGLNNTTYDRKNNNHIMISLGKDDLRGSFASYNSFKDKIKIMSGDISLFLYFRKNTFNNSDADQIKYAIECLSDNINVERLSIIIVAVDYDAAYSQVYDICYTDPVAYNSRAVSKLILKSMIIKIIGPDGARKINRIRSLFMRN